MMIMMISIMMIMMIFMMMIKMFVIIILMMMILMISMMMILMMIIMILMMIPVMIMMILMMISMMISMMIIWMMAMICFLYLAEGINASVSTLNNDETPNGFNNHLNAMSKPPALVLNTGVTLYLQRWIAMFTKRYLHSRRHKIAIVSQLLMPLVFTLFALIAAETIPKPEDSPPLVLTTAMFDSNYAPYGTDQHPSR